MKIYKSQVRWIDWKVVAVLAVLAGMFIYFQPIFGLFFYILIALVYVYLRWKLARLRELDDFKSNKGFFVDKASEIILPDDEVSGELEQMGRSFPMNYVWWEERRKIGRMKFVLSELFIGRGFAVYIPVIIFSLVTLFAEGKNVYGLLVVLAICIAGISYSVNSTWHRFERYRTSGEDDYKKH